MHDQHHRPAYAEIELLSVRWRGAPAAAHTPATRLRLERLIGTLDLHPPGMPSGALLIIRRVEGLPPLTQLDSLPVTWQQQAQQCIVELYRSASSPATASAPPRPRGGGSSVLFSDAVELLTLFTRAVGREPHTFQQHWYWREIVPATARWPGAGLAAVWSRYITALPATLAELTTPEISAAAVLLSTPEVRMVTAALHQQFALPLPASRSVAVSAAATSAVSAAPAGPVVAPWRTLLPTDQLPHQLPPTTEYLLGLALMLYHAPAEARSTTFASRSAAWLHTATLSATDSVAAGAVPIPNQQAPLPPITSEAPVPAPLSAAPLPSDSNATAWQPDNASAGTSASGTANTPPLTPASTAEIAPALPRLKPVLPDGIPTALGGVLYLINLLTWLDWLHREELDGLSAWSLLEALARGLLDCAPPPAPPSTGGVDDDPLWALLAQLDGRDPGAPLSARTVPETALRLPLKQVPSAWVVVEQPERVSILAADGGYLIADIPCHGRSLEVIVQAEMARYAIQATWQRADLPPFTPLPDDLRQRLGPNAAFQVERMRGYITHILEQLFHTPVAALLAKTGRIVVSRTHIDFSMPFDQISLPARRSGLDNDPGWVPELGYIVLFHFVEEQDA